MTTLREAAQQALEQLKINRTNFRKGPSKSICKMLAGGNDEAIADLEAALAEPTVKESLPVEPTVAENATTQQQIEQTPPSDYRRGYWAGFAIGKREGRIEAEDELAKRAEPVEPVACCDLEERKALSSVKLPCDVRIGHGTHRKGSSLLALVVRSRSLYQMAKSDDYYGYASRLAVALWEKHYKDIAPQWKPLDDLMGALTQIDNMTSGLTRLAQQAEPVQEPVAWMLTDAQNTRLRFLEWQKETRPYSGEWIKTPLYTSPPQCKPLTEEELKRIFVPDNNIRGWARFQHIARAIERAHGIE